MCVSEDPLLVHQCTVPDSPHNGKAHFTAVAYKSVVTYKCKYGFMIVGDGTYLTASGEFTIASLAGQ